MTHATAEGTLHYRDRHGDQPGHYRLAQGLWLSSIGLGTYLGQPVARVDENYIAAITRAIELGCNVIDTAANYRHQHSERAVGAALQRLFGADSATRDEIVIATKGGFIAYDGEVPADPIQYAREKVVESGLASASEIVYGHCMTPRFLRAQIEQSLHNLGVASLDIYYLHNPESQLHTISRAEFRDRLQAAFATLEAAADVGLIRYYGVATWNGFRVPPTSVDYLSLYDISAMARMERGMKHRCRFIQLPLNLAMLEALTARNQSVSDETMSILEAAPRLGMSVVCSATLLQSRLLGQLPASLHQAFEGITTDAQRCVQFVRSTPGVTTALVGMSHVAHVEENLATAQVAPLQSEHYQSLFAEH